MSLDDYANNESSQQKQTHVTFTNPDHPDTSASYADDDTVREHFRAANAVQNSGVNRTAIVGDFLTAVQEDLNSEDGGAVEEFLEGLTE